MENQSEMQQSEVINNEQSTNSDSNQQIEVGLSHLKNTLNMLEKNENNDVSSDSALIERDSNQQDKHDKSSKAMKSKPKKSREVNGLEENQIFPARLRSESGRVYSSGLMVEPPNITTVLDKIPETQEPADLSNMPLRKQQPCSAGECCKNTAKIVNMIADLQQTVAEIKATSTNQTLTCAGNAGDIRRIEDMVQDNTAEIKALDEEMSDYKFQLRLLTNIVIRQDQQIASLTRKVNEAQQREMYPNLVITGIVEEPNEKPMQVYNQFVHEQLEIQELIPVHRAYRIGTGPNRPLIVELRDPTTYKPKIYKNASKLKGKRNSKGGMYFISDHLPEEYNEFRRRINDLISENKKKPTHEQFKMSAKRGRLLIDEQTYEKAVHAPAPAELMRPDEKLYKLTEEIDMVRGKDDTIKKSKFIAYAAAVHDTNDVQAAYIKVRMKFADATHVVCVYRLQGAHSPTLQDYIDDGEFGAGRVILNVLKEEKLMNIVIFLIRYHGGTNLGSVQFDKFRETAQSAIANLRKRVEELKEKERQETRENDLKHQQYLQQQKENPAFPSNMEEWNNAEENWDLADKKAN